LADITRIAGKQPKKILKNSIFWKGSVQSAGVCSKMTTVAWYAAHVSAKSWFYKRGLEE